MKNDEIKQQNHDKIKATASVLFFINGIEATNMYQIAAASGISKVSLYKYYESKYDIARDLLTDSFVENRKRFEAEWRDDPKESGADSMKRLLAYMTEISEEDLPFLALFMEYGMYLQRFKASEIPALYEKFNRNTRDVFLAAVERGQRDSSISYKGDPESLFETVVDVIRGNCAFYMLKNADDLSEKRLGELRRQLSFIADSAMLMITRQDPRA